MGLVLFLQVGMEGSLYVFVGWNLLGFLQMKEEMHWSTMDSTSVFKNEHDIHSGEAVLILTDIKLL